MMKKFNEDKFKNQVKIHIQRCRPGDWEHAKRVVKWVKKIGKKRIDLSTIIKAAYVHDVGWRDLVPKNKKLTKAQLKTLEQTANKNSSQFVREILKTIGESENEIKKILKLVKAADKHQSGNETQAVIVDADNLSKLCIEHVREKYQSSDWKRMLELWQREFPKRIKTKIGKSCYPNLLKKLEKEICGT